MPPLLPADAVAPFFLQHVPHRSRQWGGVERAKLTRERFVISMLSYWSGAHGQNPIRYTGGLWGGAWVTSYLSALGNDRFDGAYLVQNFENLNLANSFWTKQYNVYANVDTESSRYLDFEKWWTGFFKLTTSRLPMPAPGPFVFSALNSP